MGLVSLFLPVHQMNWTVLWANCFIMVTLLEGKRYLVTDREVWEPCIAYPWCVRSDVKRFKWMILFHSHKNLLKYHYSHFTDEEMEPERVQQLAPPLQSWYWCHKTLLPGPVTVLGWVLGAPVLGRSWGWERGVTPWHVILLVWPQMCCPRTQGHWNSFA